jgi:hypothetical protein
MASNFQYSTTLRNAQLDQIATAIGATGHLAIFTGTQPANCATATTGTTLVDITLPASPMAAASSGSVAKSGTWSGTASGTGTAGYYRIFSSGTLTGGCVLQGTVGSSASDINLDNTSIASTQTVTISTYTVTAGNP